MIYKRGTMIEEHGRKIPVDDAYDCRLILVVCYVSTMYLLNRRPLDESSWFKKYEHLDV